jgi:hypothetical protein
VVLQPGSDPFDGQPGFRRVFEDPGYRVYRVEGNHSRAYTVDRGCLERRGPDRLADCATGRATVEQPDSERRVLRLPPPATPTPRLLLTGEVFFPGWHAETDGADPEVERLGYLAAVELPAGVSEVRMRYRPPLMWLGAAISLLALLGVALVALAGLRNLRTPGRVRRAWG